MDLLAGGSLAMPLNLVTLSVLPFLLDTYHIRYCFMKNKLTFIVSILFVCLCIYTIYYSQQNIIPAMIQALPSSLQKKKIACDRFDIKNLKNPDKPNIVCTGVNIKRIRNIDIKQATTSIEFEIYFHYATKDCHPEELKFLNAAQSDLNLKRKYKRILDNEIFACYEGQGLFYLDHFPGTYLFNRHLAGIQFQHKSLPVSHLIYIWDKQSEVIPQKENIIEPLSGWVMTDIHVFQDVEMKTTLGNPEYLHAYGGKMGFSRFNHCISFKSSQFSFRGLLSGPFALRVCWVSAVLLFMSIFIVQWPRAMWGVITICAFLFVMSGESIIMFGLAPRLTGYQLQWMNIGFSIMWWLVSAYCLNMFIHRFVFTSMTKKEKLHVANIVPRFVSFLLYAIACLGIVAYVFEQEISRFLATGGIFAMMIGLAVKMNVADILSGIAINIESPFRLGDWIKVDQYEGMVIDITWRSTRVKTGENAVLCIPNSKATESSIQNYNTPGELNWIKLKVPFSHLVSPETVENILTAAVFATRNVITTPSPKIFYKGTTELNAWFDIFFCINDYANRKRRIDDVWTSIWKHLRFAEVTLSMMGQSFRFPHQKLFDILDRLDILEGIGIHDKSELVPHFKRKTFAADQIIVNHDELKSDGFYIIRKGAVCVYFPSDDGELIEVDRMGAGDYFGETGLLGEAYATQIKAVTDVSIDAISGEILFACVEDREPFLDQLRHLRLRRSLARKQQKSQYEEAQAVKNKKKESFLLHFWRGLRRPIASTVKTDF
jgi:branched-chain amino acid transport system substrate-binding protein